MFTSSPPVLTPTAIVPDAATIDGQSTIPPPLTPKHRHQINLRWDTGFAVQLVQVFLVLAVMALDLFSDHLGLARRAAEQGG